MSEKCLKRMGIQVQESNSEMVSLIKDRVYGRLDMSQDLEDNELMDVIDECVLEESRITMIPIRQRQELAETVFNAIRRLDVLQDILEDDSITEIMINGKDNIFIERNGRIEKSGKVFDSDARLEDIAQKIAALSNRIVNASVPIVDTRLADGSRVCIILPPVALNGPIITVRKFFEIPLTIEKLIELGSVNTEVAAFLE